MSDLLTLEYFTPHVGKTVYFKGTHFAFPLDRTEGDGGTPPPGWMRVPFTLIFSGPRGRDALLPEGQYDCEIEGGPTLSLYVAPIHTPGPDRQEYQASFN